MNEVRNRAHRGAAGGSLPLPDLVCLSHLRWDLVFQRPQHLLSRFARERRVFFVEEPIWGQGPARMEVTPRPERVHVAIPHLPHGTGPERAEDLQKELLDEMLQQWAVGEFILWYYTPMALGFSRHLQPLAVVYDVMDELSMFRFAPQALLEREAELYGRADVVFTGGQSLYETKRPRHPNVHLFPSSIDAAHFGQARQLTQDPEDQAPIPHPRLGYFGVIDERMDLELLAGVAAARPEWQLVMVGPVVKIAPEDLPRRPNLHYLGAKPYAELPSYVAGWQVALLPFARNDSTRFISPTKTPEYLAAGKPAVSTPIRDVVHPYGSEGLVHIAETVPEFVAAIEAALAQDPHASGWLARVDRFLTGISWDRTWAGMVERIEEAVRRRRGGEPLADAQNDSEDMLPASRRGAMAAT